MKMNSLEQVVHDIIHTDIALPVKYVFEGFKDFSKIIFCHKILINNTDRK